MNILLVSFNGRDNGNCDGIIKFISSYYNTDLVSSIYIYNLNIHGCFNCNYECFSKSFICPYIKDDIGLIYNKSSIKGELIKCKTVQNEVINFIDSLI